MSNISKAFLLKRYKSSKRRFLEVANLVMLIMVLLVLSGMIFMLNEMQAYAQEIPSEDAIRQNIVQHGENTKLYDRHGTLLYTFKDPNRDREYVNYEDIPDVVIAAVLAAEDKDFFIHEGIDYLGMAKGVTQTLLSNGGKVAGGSTVTQQLVKQTLLTEERTFDRKIKESMITLYVERDYSKEEILEYYLNVTNYGGRVTGIKTAAKAYFGKSLSELTLNEAIYLVSLVQSPSEYSPLFATDREKAIEKIELRRKLVMNQLMSNPRIVTFLNTSDTNYLYMRDDQFRQKYEQLKLATTVGEYESSKWDAPVEQRLFELAMENIQEISTEGSIPVVTEAEALTNLANSKAKNLEVAGLPKKYYTQNRLHGLIDSKVTLSPADEPLLAPHWVFYIRDRLAGAPYNLSLQDLYSGGYEIKTSLDLNIQNLAQTKLKEGVDRYGRSYGFQNGALVTVDARTGEILAMVGSKGYDLPSDPNNKKFDPKVNVTVSKQTLGSSLKPWVVYLAFNSGKYKPTTIVKDSPQKFYGSYRPKNFDGQFWGDMTIRKALLESRNLPMLKLLYSIGDWQLGEFMEKAGYQKQNNYGLAAAIGGVDESLLDHTEAYTGLANGGKIMEHMPVLSIKDSSGKMIFEAQPKVKMELNRSSIQMVNNILGDKSFTTFTYGNKFIGGQKLAGKTGTSDANKDTYYMGYGPKVVTGVWAGNNDNSRMSSQALGSTTTLLMWNGYMKEFFKQFPEYSEYGSY